MNRRINLMILGCLLCAIFTSCGKKSVIGTWIEPNDGSVDTIGFSLEKDGSMIPINQGYAEYKTWEQSGKTIIFKGEYTGYDPREFSDTMNIVTLSKDSLVLEQGGYTLRYVKK